ncbi:ribosome-associated ATPase/putative transporter RbbA [Anderseniella sp. Alg231-50]|uniref:ribosome-associated ATPase/putative transporter RbbA n=1 Tax=Anderseniella sp. Alg231-50 TaxID=1922226 RepID=UPI000D55112E
MTPASDSVAQLAAVTHKYGAVAALDDVTVNIPAGCMAGLIGPDGVGKSTLLALVSGVRKMQTGSVHALSGDMHDNAHRRHCFNRIAYMPQGLGKNLYPTLSIYENLDFFGRLFGQGSKERHRRIGELLQATGLAPFPDRPAGKLSGGMKQKLGLCCALIHDPDLLVLDEPTTGVDPLSRRQFWELIDRIRARRPNMSVIVATAYMDEAEGFDWLAAMDDGKIIATGSPAELKSQTSADTLEAAFIALLPEHKRSRHKQVTVPPRINGDGQFAIQASGLTKRFGDFTAVDHVSFDIERGEIFGFLGSNGCGKTTTMKMLTGLLSASEGEARLFSKKLNARDMQTRRRVGYMSQSFSLYGELTVLQNLELHAHLFHLPKDQRNDRITDLLQRFDLHDVHDHKPDSLPLGVKQRLQLAVAILHRPEVLILDEPTSGVDPIARDEFWQLLIELSRDDGVTIFISTHFMNEASRCDRISLMHAGKVLAVGAPQELADDRHAGSLDEAFVAYLEDAIGEDSSEPADNSVVAEIADTVPETRHTISAFSAQRMWAYASREAKELLRDPIRLAFALLGPILLMVTFGYGISFDVEELPYAVYDQDRSHESRQFLENFSSSRYFIQQPPITSPSGVETRLKSGELKFAIEIPSGFGKNMLKGEQPEVGVWLDGAMPFRAETTRGYVQGVTLQYIADMSTRQTGRAVSVSPVSIETRFRYNQAFKSTYAITPGVIMLLCILIPAMMTAVGIVREKEMGSITNLYSTPVTKIEFLLGKQLPYVAIAYASFVSLCLLVILVFAVPLKGSFLALAVGALFYVWATTGFGMLVSSFVNSQIAAIFATAILAMVPTMNFSGFMTPVSTLGGGAKITSALFPASYFQQISVGSFTKALRFSDLWPNHLFLIGFGLAFFLIAAVFLRKQDV